MNSLSYYIGKAIQKIQIPTMRDCEIDPTAKVCQRSNLIKVKMGRYSYIGASNSLNNVSIGSFCSIASYCAIGGGSHPTDYVSTSPVFLEGANIFGINFASIPFDPSGQVRIGNDVWIGEACFVNAGVKVGDGAIVGAHSVVTKDVEPYAIVAGAPAQIIRYRFNQETVRMLNRLRWWDFPESQLKEYAPSFNDPDALFRKLRHDG